MKDIAWRTTALVGILCVAFAVGGLGIAIICGDPLWQPLLTGALAWAVLTPVTLAAMWVVLHD